MLESRIVRNADAGRVQKHLRQPHTEDIEMKLTVIIQDISISLHVGGAITHRCVSVDLTDEQEKALRFRHAEETYAVMSIDEVKNEL